MTQPIHVFGQDDFVTCPQCGRLAEFEAEPCDEDHDGPIYKATCAKHGDFLWQIIEDD